MHAGTHGDRRRCEKDDYIVPSNDYDADVNCTSWFFPSCSLTRTAMEDEEREWHYAPLLLTSFPGPFQCPLSLWEHLLPSSFCGLVRLVPVVSPAPNWTHFLTGLLFGLLKSREGGGHERILMSFYKFRITSSLVPWRYPHSAHVDFFLLSFGLTFSCSLSLVLLK